VILNGEYRDGTFDNKQNITLGAYTQPNDDIGLAASSLYSNVYNDVNNTKNIEARVALAYRPQQSDLIVLNKLEYIDTNERGETEGKTQKLINNLQANYTPSDTLELSLQYGVKYVFDEIEDYDHKGWVQLGGIDISYDITKKMDIGLQTSALFAQDAGNFDYGAGVYIGYNLVDSMWLSLGYNWIGFNDNDFDLQTYRTQGPYVKFRMKFDQKTIGDTAKALSW
jgi:opacity protein-like surface antigen